jgi:hypothetical protein
MKWIMIGLVLKESIEKESSRHKKTVILKTK